MIRKDFEQGIADFDLARTSTSLAQEQPAPTDSSPEGSGSVLPPKSEGEKVAGLGTKMVKKLMGEERGELVSRSSRELVKNRPPPTAQTGSEAIKQTMAEFKEFQKTQKPGEKLADIDEPAQIDQLVEQAATAEFPERRNWVEVRKRTSTVKKVMKELQPVTVGRQTGPLSDVQLHGVSRIVATAYDDVARLLPKIASGEASPEEQLMLMNAKQTYEVMHGYLTGQGAETARALNALKMSKSTLDSKNLASYKAMFNDPSKGVSKYLRQWADAVSNRMEKGDSIGKAMQWTGAIIKNDYWRASVEYWKNNQLSGIGTHVLNNASVHAHMLYETVAIRPGSALVGTIRTGGVRNTDRVQAAEAVAPLYSAYAGVRGWLGLFWDNLYKGERNFIAADKVEDSQALSEMIGKMPGGNKVKKIANIATSASFRILTATDEANRGIAFSQELYGLAARQASKDGLTGKAHVIRMSELLDDPPIEMYDQAMSYAAQITFTDVEKKGWIASTSKSLRVMTGEIPPLQYFIPYINTPSRLLHVATEMSPLAPFSKRLRDDLKAGGAKADIATAKMVGGMGMGLLYWQLYESGVITGGGPPDYKAQNMLKADGWQPWGITDNDGKMWGMERMEPFSKAAQFSESLATFVGYMDRAKYAATNEDKESNFVLGVLSLSQNMMDGQWVEQASGFMKAIEGEQSFTKWAARTTAGFMPYHAFFKSAKQYQDQAKRQISSDPLQIDFWRMVGDQAEGNFPNALISGYGSENVRPKRNWDGEVMMPGMSDFAAATSPFGPTELKSDAATKLLFENGVVPSEPSSVLTLGLKQFSLLQLDPSGGLYDLYLRSVGKGRRYAVEKVMKSSGFKRMLTHELGGPNSVISVALARAIAAGKQKGLVDFLNQINDRVLSDPTAESALAMQLGEDPKAMIESAIRNLDHELEGPVRFRPTQPPLEYPIPEMK